MTRTSTTDMPGLITNRACRNCVQIKVKCVPVQETSQGPQRICQRCHRLGKECTTPVPAIRKQRAKSTKITLLEQRVSELAALLTPAQIASETTDRHPRHTSASSVPDHGQSEHTSPVLEIRGQAPLFPGGVREVEEHAACWSNGGQPLARSGSPSMFIPHAPGRKDGSQLSREAFCPVYLEEEFEKKLFTSFRSCMLPECPFVVIDPNVAAADFKESRPFAYWACIYAASYRYRTLQQTLNDEMMKALGHRMLVSGSKSVDLLQGLMIMMSWHHNISHYSPHFMNLLHLAQAQLVDLGVAKPVRTQDKLRIAWDTTAMMHGTDNMTLNVGMDEKRALLGCFCLSSKAALTFSRMEPMRYSQHMDDICKDLKLASECETDLLLVELVSVHRIFGKYLQIDSGSGLLSQPYRSKFRDEIERYRQALPSSIQGHPLVECELLSNSLCFLEPSYSLDNTDRVDRLNALYTCVDIGNQAIDIITNLPIQRWPNLTFMTTMSLIEVLVIYCRLSLFRAASWDTHYAQSTVNVCEVLERLQRKYEQIHEYEASTYSNYAPWRFNKYAKKVEHIRAWFNAKVMAEEANDPSYQFDDTLFGSFDDSAWQDLMGSWIDM